MWWRTLRSWHQEGGGERIRSSRPVLDIWDSRQAWKKFLKLQTEASVGLLFCVLWLYDNEIDFFSPSFPSQYLKDVNCPFKIQDRQEAIDWLLGLAVRLEYGDNGMFCAGYRVGVGLWGFLKDFYF
jgi:hypothetical protein